MENKNRPSFNDWVKEFNVSSMYIPQIENSVAYTFDIKKFRENLNKFKTDDPNKLFSTKK